MQRQKVNLNIHYTAVKTNESFGWVVWQLYMVLDSKSMLKIYLLLVITELGYSHLIKMVLQEVVSCLRGKSIHSKSEYSGTSERVIFLNGAPEP